MTPVRDTPHGLHATCPTCDGVFAIILDGLVLAPVAVEVFLEAPAYLQPALAVGMTLVDVR